MTTIAPGRRLSRSFFARDPLVVAPDLLGRILISSRPEGRVAVRITEVEAYHGPEDPASHAFRGRTPRTEVMFGPAGHLYVYFVYGMHWCANVVTGADGEASAVLLRAGEIVDGIELAQGRRPAARRPGLLGRGPAGLATVLGLTGADTGADLCASDAWLRIHSGPRRTALDVASGPRVGINVAADRPWRFWVAGAESVTDYRPGIRRNRSRGSVG